MINKICELFKKLLFVRFVILKAMIMYSGTSVYELNVFSDFGEDSGICVCVGKWVALFVMQGTVCKGKQKFAELFCSQTKLLANSRLHKPRH